jgi:hypothetical protein
MSYLKNYCKICESMVHRGISIKFVIDSKEIQTGEFYCLTCLENYLPKIWTKLLENNYFVKKFGY